MTILGAFLIWNLKIYRNLAIFFIYQSVLMLLNFLEETQITSSTHLITPAFTLVVGPLLYFFVRSLVNDTALPLSKKCAHFIPMLLALPFTNFTQVVIALGTVSQILYLAASFRLLSRYHLASMGVRSDAYSMKLTWIIRALSVFAVIVIIDLIRLNMQKHTSGDLKAAWYFINVLVFFCISLYLLLKVLKNPQLFDGMLPYEQSVQPTTPEDKQQDLPTAKALCQNIESIILQKELFKQQRITVTDIANETGLTVKNISWAINLGANQNFCEYINALRVKDMKEKIIAGIPKGQKLLDLAFESGFNSKSTFNTVFKREVGMTPTQFLQKNRPE
ncbi:helix-turn-helix domain-containing protein [Pleionea sp. CnH1-48]|uniref:helix-turn-helix domain-containing protein n=1 Tax=Pleionea sp. CnH1-48 TaxID=2954494 RepID=UPI0020975396|nr:AraC family transcriptional regulator [Pleionea sp. CnH1-48]